MAEIYSFAPIVGAKAQVLILGSMPGKASLAAGQYYAHPRNQFWPILGELIGAYPDLDYAERITLLINRRIAVWDVLRSCYRSSSLDSDIEKSSMVSNDFGWLLQTYPEINRIFFNGATAEQTFRRQVLPSLPCPPKILQRLPSTSPAHAGMSLQQKLDHWRSIID